MVQAIDHLNLHCGDLGAGRVSCNFMSNGQHRKATIGGSHCTFTTLAMHRDSLLLKIRKGSVSYTHTEDDSSMSRVPLQASGINKPVHIYCGPLIALLYKCTLHNLLSNWNDGKL